MPAASAGPRLSSSRNGGRGQDEAPNVPATEISRSCLAETDDHGQKLGVVRPSIATSLGGESSRRLLRRVEVQEQRPGRHGHLLALLPIADARRQLVTRVQGEAALDALLSDDDSGVALLRAVGLHLDLEVNVIAPPNPGLRLAVPEGGLEEEAPFVRARELAWLFAA
jgi:hypothetical protein